MHAPDRDRPQNALAAGLGALAFGVVTTAAIMIASAPGGSYSASEVASFVTKHHSVVVLVVFHLALLAIVGLVVALVHIRDSIAAAHRGGSAASVVWGCGVAGAAVMAGGWGILGGESVARLEGGSAAVPAGVTYVLSEIGVMFIFGCGPILLGCALVAYAIRAAGLIPAWARWSTLVAGVAGIAGLAFFSFFVFMLWWVVVGAALIRGSRAAAPARLAASAGA
jgi:hypothetical protein